MDNTQPPTNYSPIIVTVSETMGVIAMSVVASILAIALLRANARNRELLDKLRQPGPLTNDAAPA